MPTCIFIARYWVGLLDWSGQLNMPKLFNGTSILSRLLWLVFLVASAVSCESIPSITSSPEHTTNLEELSDQNLKATPTEDTRQLTIEGLSKLITHRDGIINVNIPSGVFVICQPLQKLLNQPHERLIIRGSGSGRTIIRSGSDDACADEKASHINQKYQDYDLSETYYNPIPELPTMAMRNGKVAWLRRIPSSGFLRIQAYDQAKHEVTLPIDIASPEYLMGQKLYLSGYPGKGYAFARILVTPVAKLTSGNEGSVFKLASPEPRFGFKSGERVYIEEAPHDNRNDRDYLYSAVANFLKARGVKSIELSGLTIEGFRGDAIALDDVSIVNIRDLTIQEIGGSGIKLKDSGGSITNSRLYNTGMASLNIVGSSASSSPQFTVRNSRFSGCGWRVRSYQPCIYISDFPASITYNYFGDTSHSAIIYSGGGLHFEHNSIYRTNTETSDSGAIYTGKNWPLKPNFIRKNLFLQLNRGEYSKETMGIYLDDLSSDNFIQENVFIDVNQPVFVGGGSSNTVSENMFVNSSPALHLDDRGNGWQKGLVTHLQSNVLSGCSIDPLDIRCMRLESHYSGAPVDNTFSNNIIIQPKEHPPTFSFYGAAKKYIQMQGNSEIYFGHVSENCVDLDRNSARKLYSDLVASAVALNPLNIGLGIPPLCSNGE